MGTRSLKDSDIQVGNKYSSNNFGDFVVIEIKSSKEVYIKFDNTGGINKVWSIQIRKGEVKDKFAPTVYGFGFIGNENIKQDVLTKKASDLWRSMILRCYSTESNRSFASYADKTVCEEWRSFLLFKLWFIEKVNSGHYKEGWHLDKDLLFKGNKVYSPTTCVFIPKEINLALPLSKNGKDYGYIEYRGKCRASCMNILGKTEHLYGTKEECINWYKNKKRESLLSKAELFKGELEPQAYLALINYANDILTVDR